MNLKQLATGVLSGYAFKGLQLAISLLIVPFLLDPEVLGVENYGRMFAIFGITGAIGIAVVGFHSSAERAIAQAIGGVYENPDRSVGELLGSGTKILTLATIVFVLPIIGFDSEVLSWIGVPSDGQYRVALIAACAISVLENALQLMRAPLIARGDISYVNMVGMVELLGRTAVVIGVFTWFDATVAGYLSIQAAFTLLRQLAFVTRLPKDDLRGVLRAPMRDAVDVVRYAGPVSLAEGSSIVVRTMPVLLASRLLGAQEAGYVAVIANTLQGYLLQAFLSVVQPLALPVVSRFRLSNASESLRTRFLEFESVYSILIAVAFNQIIFWTPLLIPIWLGPGFDLIVFPTQVMIAGCGLQTCNLIRRATLIGQGALPEAVPAILGSAVAAVVTMAVGVITFESWIAAIAASTGFLLVSSAAGIDRVFDGFVRPLEMRVHVLRSIAVCLVLSLGAAFSSDLVASSYSGVVMRAIACALSGLAVAFMTILPLKRASTVLHDLYRMHTAERFE